MPLQNYLHPFFIAHRGASQKAPENTLIAIQKAYELGLQWVEFDVMLTSDEQAILMHDTRLDRTTNVTGEVSEFNYADLKNFSAGQWFAKEYESEIIPLFSDVVNFLCEKKMNAVVEIKPYPGFEAKTAEKVLQILKLHWPSFYEYAIVSSFSKQALVTIRELDPKVCLGISTEHWSDIDLYYAQKLKAMSVHIDHKALTPAICHEIIQYSYDIFSYTINQAERAQEIMNWGVKAIFSDAADILTKNLFCVNEIQKTT